MVLLKPLDIIHNVEALSNRLVGADSLLLYKFVAMNGCYSACVRQRDSNLTPSQI